MLNLIGGADVRGLPGSDVASSILLPSEMEKLLLLLRAKYVDKRSFIFQTKLGGLKQKEMERRVGGGGLCCRCWGVSFSLACAAIHWLPCDGVTMQSVE